MHLNLGTLNTGKTHPDSFLILENKKELKLIILETDKCKSTKIVGAKVCTRVSLTSSAECACSKDSFSNVVGLKNPRSIGATHYVYSTFLSPKKNDSVNVPSTWRYPETRRSL